MTAHSPGWLSFAAVGLAGALWVAPAAAAPMSGLSASERAALTHGTRVERPLHVMREGRSYVGGFSYQVVNSSPPEVISALLDVKRLPDILPRTRAARLVSSDGAMLRVELEQGTAPFVARYTIVIERTRPEELKFWIDPGASNDIRDVFGYFRAEPWHEKGSVVTVAALVDLGGGPFQGFFRDRVQAVVLRSVTGIRDFLEPEQVAGVGYDRCFACRR